MKINIGDLFLTGNHNVFLLTKIEPNGVMLGYMSNDGNIPKEVGFAWLFQIDTLIEKASWKHFPVKK